jgi:hypothetical protein
MFKAIHPIDFSKPLNFVFGCYAAANQQPNNNDDNHVDNRKGWNCKGQFHADENDLRLNASPARPKNLSIAALALHFSSGEVDKNHAARTVSSVASSLAFSAVCKLRTHV